MAKFNPFQTTTNASTTTQWGKTGRIIRDKIFDGDLVNAQGAVENSNRELGHAFNAFTSAKTAAASGTPIPEATQEAFDVAARNFNRDVEGLKFHHGKLGASVKGFFQSCAETLGFSTEKWSSSKIKVGKDEATAVADALNSAKKVQGNILERIVSKPIRIAARFPKTSMVTGALVAVAAAGTFFHKRAARRTQEEAMVEATAPAAQANVTYQVTPEQWAAVEAKMRGTGAPSTGHAENVLAARQAQTPAPVGPAV